MSQVLEARCPNCQAYTQFTFSGSQHWPAEVARKLGLPTVIGLWTCSACQSTISEVALQPAPQRGIRITAIHRTVRRRPPQTASAGISRR